jgi:hypothetical protein
VHAHALKHPCGRSANVAPLAAMCDWFMEQLHDCGFVNLTHGTWYAMNGPRGNGNLDMVGACYTFCFV